MSGCKEQERIQPTYEELKPRQEMYGDMVKASIQPTYEELKHV